MALARIRPVCQMPIYRSSKERRGVHTHILPLGGLRKIRSVEFPVIHTTLPMQTLAILCVTTIHNISIRVLCSSCFLGDWLVHTMLSSFTSTCLLRWSDGNVGESEDPEIGSFPSCWTSPCSPGEWGKLLPSETLVMSSLCKACKTVGCHPMLESVHLDY